MPDLIGELTDELAGLKAAISGAYDELAKVEDVWLDRYDATFESMQEECREQGRKSDPAEHAVTSRARKLYPAEYRAWKNAKREIERLKEVSDDTRSQISGHQTRAREVGKLPTVQRQGPRAVAS